jgi:hypothetical protein
MKAFSVNSGICAEYLRCTRLSVTDIFIASDAPVRIVRASFGRNDQMLVLSEDAPRLKASRVIQRCDDRCENTRSPYLLATVRDELGKSDSGPDVRNVSHQ